MKKLSFYVVSACLIFGCKNQATPEVVPEPAGIKKVATWGDSLTEGGGVTMPEFKYPAQLQKLSGYHVYNGGVGGQTSTQIKTRMLAAADKKEDNAIIWAGTNNFWEPEVVKADIAAMVAFLSHKRFLVLPVINGSSYPKGSSSYNTIMKINSDLKAAYPDNFLDVRSYLISQSDGSALDELSKANDVIPPSLKSDKIHLNDKGYTVLAAYIYKNFAAIRK
ncbi:MAG: hypothetical protein K0S09_1590 [Sphingobacteriaceae bacterium]|jgi:lysophospholipase L1-like esterase|nr:hypothetical protein [Sphingobacteriaceae bacterium]